jgi:hypothetical protein
MAKKFLIATFLLFFSCAFCLVVGQISSAFRSGTAQPARTVEQAVAFPGPTPAPSLPIGSGKDKRQSPEDALIAELAGLSGVASAGYGEDGEIVIRWRTRAGLTDGATVRMAKVSAAGYLRRVAESGAEYSGVTLSGWAALVDEYGAETEAEVIRLYYSRATLDKIVWVNFDKENTWRIADSGDVHPLFR